MLAQLQLDGTKKYIKHGACLNRGKSRTQEYVAYWNAKQRCTAPPGTDKYKWYVSRGIEFRFNSFIEFINHIGPKPTSRHTLDRIDNNGHYEIGNVRWATQSEQQKNKRLTRGISWYCAHGEHRSCVKRICPCECGHLK